MMEKTRQELGKEERCSDVLATADRERGGAPVRFCRVRVSNAAHLWLGWLSESIAKVCEVLAELWLEWCWLWCSGELTRARRSSTASLRCCGECAKEKQEMEMEELGNHGQTLGPLLACGSPLWLGRSGQWRRAAYTRCLNPEPVGSL